MKVRVELDLSGFSIYELEELISTAETEKEWREHQYGENPPLAVELLMWQSGRKVDAIKDYRRRTKSHLKFSKDILEHYGNAKRRI